MSLEKQTKRAAWILLGIGLACMVLSMQGCGSGPSDAGPSNPPSIPQPGPRDDDSIVRGVALYTVSSEQQTAMMKLFNSFMPMAYASTGTTTVTYNNAPNVTFTVNAASFAAGSLTANTLSLGSFTISALSDNNLKICNPGGNTKCTTANLRVYSTGSVAGFVNTTDSPQYGAPIYTSGQNPTTALILNTPGTNIETVSGMPTSKHTVQLSDFATTTFNVTSDFSNAGTGSYSVTYVIEYALSP